MKNRGVAAFLLIGAFLVLVAWFPFSRSLAWRRDYGQAEPLVQTIWPMA